VIKIKKMKNELDFDHDLLYFTSLEILQNKSKKFNKQKFKIKFF